MGRPKKSGHFQTLKRAQAARHAKEAHAVSRNVAFINTEPVITTDSESEIEVTRWTGGVSHEQTDNSDFS